MFKSGLIGCGNIGSRYDETANTDGIFTHAGMYSNSRAFQLECAADPDPKRRNEFSTFWNVPSMYSDYREMLAKNRFDIISIATPDETHEKIIQDILATNPPPLIFTEKPVAQSVEKALKIFRLCKEKSTTLIVDYIRRWDMRHQAIKLFLKDNGLGKIQGINGYYVRGIQHNGCQMINLLRYFFGEIKNVRAYGASSVGSIPGDPSLNLTLTLENDNCINVTALDRHGYGFSMFELDIIGTKGRIRLTDGGQSLDYYESIQDPQFANFSKLTRKNVPWGKSSYGDAMIRAGHELSGLIERPGLHPTNSLSEAIKDLCVIESALESADKNNIQIDIKYSEH